MIKRTLPEASFPRSAVLTALLGAILLTLVLFPAVLAAQDDWGSLQSFEDRDLSRWKLSGEGNLAPDSTYATERTKNMRADLGKGAVLSLDLRGLWRMEEIIRQKFSDEGGGGWKIYEAFFTDIYTRRPVELVITFRDSLGGSWQTLRTLKKGLNHLQVRRDELQNTNFNALRSVEYSPGEPATLWLDNVRTWEYQPELDQRGKMDIVYSDSVASPHVDWQNPDASGPVRGLFAPRGGSGRAMVELMQRFELQPVTVTFEPDLGLHRWAFGDFYGTRALGYDHVTDKFTISYAYLTSELESDRPLDVIVLPPLRGWQEMPPELRQALLKRVSEGCGLVLLQPTGAGPAAGELWKLSPLTGEVRMEKYRPRSADQPVDRPAGLGSAGAWKAEGDNYITRGIPFGLIPAADINRLRYSPTGGAQVLIRGEDSSPILAVGQYGKGRVAAFAWEDGGMFPLVQKPLENKNGLPCQEYLYALLGRTVRWAAGKDLPDEVISSPGLVSDPAGKSLALKARVAFRPGSRLRCVLRDSEWGTRADTCVAAPGDGNFSLAFPGVTPSGRLIADMWLVHADGAVADFATTFHDFPKTASLAGIELASGTVKLGDKVTGKLKLSGLPSRVALALTDNRDRLLDADTLELAADSEADFALSTASCLARRAVVTARLLSTRNETVQAARAEVFVDRPHAWDDYEVMMYRFSPEILAGQWQFLDRYMERLGVTAWAAIDPDFVFLSNLNIQAETRLDTEESLDGEGEKPYREAKRLYVQTRDKKYLQRLHCMHDPLYLEQEKQSVQSQIGKFKKFGPLSYYCYEEPSFTHYGDAFDLCFSPQTLTAFRGWLKTRYGSLAALNAEWGTSFKDWESVIPDDTFGAQKRGVYASWADHRTFMEQTYAENYAWVRSAVREIDPQGLVMMTGTQRTVPQNGYDYYLLDQTIDHTQPYGEPERHRAFMRQGGKITGCTGYGVFGPKLAYEIWSRLFYGHTAGSAIFWQFSTLDPDYRLSKSGRDMMQNFAEIRHGGIAKLLSGASWTPSEVVLFWSMPSIHGTWIQDGKIVEEDGAPSAAFDRWEFNYESWRWLLEDLGVPYRVMSYQMLDQDWLAGAGAKILVLPNTIALSAEGAEKVRRFVEAGGVVVGDVQTALMDGHCKWLGKGALDDVFGVRGAAAGYLPPADYTALRGAERGLARADSRVKAAGAKEQDLGPGLPAVAVNSFGRGRAYFLNAFLAGYGRLRQEGGGAAARASAAGLLAGAGYKPLISVAPASGGDLKAVKMITYNLGREGFLVGLLKDYRVTGPTQDIEVRLPAAGFHYDVRSGRYLGQGSVIHTSLATGEIKLLASLPCQVRGIAIRGPESLRAGQRLELSLAVETEGAKEPGPHVFVVEVFDPAGEKALCYGANVAAEAGKAVWSLPSALSDRPGRWRVRVRDTASGVSAERAFELTL
jgi:hypothetical protein